MFDLIVSHSQMSTKEQVQQRASLEIDPELFLIIEDVADEEEVE